MVRYTGLALVCLTVLLVVFPLMAGKPGLPMTLKADEPAYYLMALSLARDRDLVCDELEAPVLHRGGSAPRRTRSEARAPTAPASPTY